MAFCGIPLACLLVSAALRRTVTLLLIVLEAPS
jgi:hypothetical protein